jgi:hypothetical protein
MKPLVTQKIEFGVRLENDEIVGEKKKTMPGKGGDGGGLGERESKRTRRHSLRRPAYAGALPPVHATPTLLCNTCPYLSI